MDNPIPHHLTGKAYPNLSIGQIRRFSKVLRAAGKRLPRVGYSIRIPDGTGRELCHDSRGYYII